MKIKVAIVEDEKHYSQALKKIIDFDEELLCIGQFYDGNEAMEKLRSLNPDVVLMDIKLPFVKGTDVVSLLKNTMEHTQFIMCTSFEDDESIFRSLKAGATGYLVKGESLDRIISSIKDAYKGGAPMSFGIAKRVLESFHTVSGSAVLEELTRTEREILELLSEGLQYKTIADRKCISIDTVKKHVGNIYRKLHVNNRIEAMKLFNRETMNR
ncbi:response regulator transcription factor [Weeksellaceae bacterium A-14]|uniref:response regulator transcription factor n=1 Tax=Daejeonia sp. YH14 TaxID=3439042 RepID=UPI0031E4BA72